MSTQTKSKPAKSATKKVQAPAPPATAAVRPEEVLGSLRLLEIQPCPFNIRKVFDEGDLASLAESIGDIGLKERLLVRPIPVAGKTATFTKGTGWQNVDHFQLADGERRWRALQILAETRVVDEVPVSIRFLTDDEVRAIMLATREQSRDLKPSELVAGYADLAKDHPAEWVAAKVGKPVGHVRSILRLAKLPAWALAAVDRGDLPRATAELVARVPGEESRKQAALCVLIGQHTTEPNDMKAVASLDRGSVEYQTDKPLSYRDTKDLIREHFTVELKGAPFSRKALYVWPGCEPGHERNMPDCEACPSRAGNNEEAKADGVRADVCLDPECFREKVEAHDEQERAKFRKKYKLADDADVNPDGASLVHDQPAKGWLDWNGPAGSSELNDAFHAAGKRLKNFEAKVSEIVLECPIVSGCLPRLVLDSKHKPRHLVKTSEALKTLRDAGVLKKPEPKKERSASNAPSTDTGSESPTAATKSGKSSDRLIDKVSDWAVDERAAAIAGKVLAEFGEMNFDDLDQIEQLTGDDPNTSAVWEAFRFIARFLIRDHITFGHERGQIVERALELEPDSTLGRSGVADAEKKLATLGHWATLALCLRLAAECELQSAPAGPFGTELLAWAELDWDALRDQARRVLNGEPSADEKVAAAEAAQAEPPPIPPPVVLLSEIDGLPDAAFDALFKASITGLSALLEAVEKANELGDVPLRNKLFPYFVKIGVKKGPAATAADVIADHIETTDKSASRSAEPEAEPVKGESIEPLGLSEGELFKAVCCGKIGRWNDGPKVVPIITVNKRPHIVIGSCSHASESPIANSWILRPLWTEQQYAERGHPEPNEEVYLKDIYLGVKVASGKGKDAAIYRVGSRGEERRLIQARGVAETVGGKAVPS